MDGIESLLGSLHFDLFLAAAETVPARTMNLSFLKILILLSLKTTILIISYMNWLLPAKISIFLVFQVLVKHYIIIKKNKVKFTI